MAIQYSFKNMNRSACQSNCLDKFGCPDDRCPDFTIRRHDTKPDFKIRLEDCDGALDVQGLVAEVNMWAKAKLKKRITSDCEYFRLADDIGFEQIMVGDIIVMERVRSPEYMLVLGFDECNKLVRVQRGYRNTTPSDWKKGASLKIFRIMNSPAQTELVFEDETDVDGTVTEDVLTESYLVYEWSAEDVCLPGCYWLEFKLIKMKGLVLYLPGGYWTGDVHQYKGSYYTGTIHTDSSVLLSFDSVENKYLIDTDAWEGLVHAHSGFWFTGSTHNDGSVSLDRTDDPSDETVTYSPSSTVASTGVFVEQPSIPGSFPLTVTPCTVSGNDISCAISFTNPNLKAEDFGCLLDENIEWIRRFPLQGEGFLIRIENTPTAEV